MGLHLNMSAIPGASYNGLGTHKAERYTVSRTTALVIPADMLSFRYGVFFFICYMLMYFLGFNIFMI